MLTLTEHPSATTFAAILALNDPNALVPNRMYGIDEPGGRYRRIYFSGGYTITNPSAVYFRIIRAWDSVTVQVADANGDLQDWNALEGYTHGGGTWGGWAARVPAGDVATCAALIGNTKGALYKIQFSESSDGSSPITSTCEFNVGLKDWHWGQSNGFNLIRSNSDPGFTVPAANPDVWLFHNGTNEFVGGADGWTRHSSTNGPMVIAGLNDLSTALNMPVALSYWCKNGAGIGYFFPTAEGGYWDAVEGALFTSTGQQYLDAYGADHNVETGVQGESDSPYAWRANASTAKLREYRDALNDLHTQFCARSGKRPMDVPMLHLTLGAYIPSQPGGGESLGPNRDFPSQAQVNDQILSANEKHPHIHCIGTAMGETMGDSIHYAASGNIRNGKKFAKAIQAIWGVPGGGYAPKITHGQEVNATTTDVMIQHGTGLDFTGKASSTGFTGFEVYDSATGDWLSATGERVNATTIRLTHASVSGGRRVAYAATGAGPGANPVWDTSSINNPLLPTPWQGIEVQSSYRSARLKYIGGYDYQSIVGYVAYFDTPHPQVFRPKHLGKPQYSDRVFYLFVMYPESNGTGGGAATVTLIPNQGNSVVADVISANADVSVMRAILPGYVTEITPSCARVGGMKGPIGLHIFEAARNDIANLTPTVYYSGPTTGLSKSITMTSVPAHAAAAGVFTGGSDQTDPSSNQLDCQDIIPYLDPSDSSWDVPFGGAFQQNGNLVFCRSNATAAATDVVTCTKPWAYTTAACAIVLESNYTAVTPITQAHNGGRGQVVLAHWSNDVGSLLINRFLDGSQVGFANTETAAIDRTTIDDRGYPLPGQSASYWMSPVDTQAERPGRYILSWEGTATVTISLVSLMTAKSGSPSITGSYLASGTNVEVYCTTDQAAGTIYGISISGTDAGNPIRNLAFYHEDDEADFKAGKLFQAAKLDALRAMNIGTLRWQEGSNCYPPAAARMRDLRRMSDAKLGGYDPIKRRWAGTATLAGDTYSATLSTFENTHGDIVVVKWGSAGGTKLSVNGGTAYPLKSAVGDYNATPVSGSRTVCIFDEFLQAWLCVGGVAAMRLYEVVNGDTGFVYNHWPLEVITALANEINANVWFCYPSTTGDPPTDLMPGVASFMANNLHPWLKFKCEFETEPWFVAIPGLPLFSVGWYYCNRGVLRYGMPNTNANEAYFAAGAGITRAHALSAFQTRQQFGGSKERNQWVVNLRKDGQYTPYLPAVGGLKKLFDWGTGEQLHATYDADYNGTAPDIRNTKAVYVDGLQPGKQWLSRTVSASYVAPWLYHWVKESRDFLSVAYPSLYTDAKALQAVADLYNWSLAKDTGDTATMATIGNRAVTGPSGTSDWTLGETKALMDWHALADSKFAELAGEAGLSFTEYEGGWWWESYGNADLANQIVSITPGATTVVKVLDARIPPVGTYVSFDFIECATITVNTGGTGYTVISVDTISWQGSKVYALLMKNDGTEYLCGTPSTTVTVGQNLAVTSHNGFAKLDTGPSGTPYKGFKILAIGTHDGTGIPVTIEADTTGNTYTAPAPGIYPGGMRLSFTCPITAIDRSGTAGVPAGQTRVTLGAGMPMPTYNILNIMGAWAKNSGAFTNGRVQVYRVDPWSSNPTSIDGVARTILLDFDSAAMPAYSGGGVLSAALGLNSWVGRMGNTIKHDQPVLQEIALGHMNLMHDTGLAEEPSWLYVRDRGDHGLMDTRGWFGGENGYIALGWRAFTDPTPAQVVSNFIVVPTSGTEPLSCNGIDTSTGVPDSWLWEKNDGSGWTTISTSQNPSFSLNEGVWSIRLTVDNTVGIADTLTRTDYITVTSSGGGGGTPGAIQKLGTKFPRFNNKWWRLGV